MTPSACCPTNCVAKGATMPGARARMIAPVSTFITSAMFTWFSTTTVRGWIDCARLSSVLRMIELLISCRSIV